MKWLRLIVGCITAAMLFFKDAEGSDVLRNAGRFYLYIEPGFSWKVCPAGSNYNWATGWCEIILGAVCPPGMTYVPALRGCVSIGECPPNSRPDPQNPNICIADPIITCAQGLQYNSLANICYDPNSSPVCNYGLHYVAFPTSSLLYENLCANVTDPSDPMYNWCHSGRTIYELCLGTYDLQCLLQGRPMPDLRRACPEGSRPVYGGDLYMAGNPQYGSVCGWYVTEYIDHDPNVLCELLYGGGVYNGVWYWEGDYVYLTVDPSTLTSVNFSAMIFPANDPDVNINVRTDWTDFCVVYPLPGGGCPQGMERKSIYRVVGDDIRSFLMDHLEDNEGSEVVPFNGSYELVEACVGAITKCPVGINPYIDFDTEYSSRIYNYPEFSTQGEYITDPWTYYVCWFPVCRP
ncbi:MAG: hypothetical protein QXO76_00215 [Thermoproteota archaeon]